MVSERLKINVLFGKGQPESDRVGTERLLVAVDVRDGAGLCQKKLYAGSKVETKLRVAVLVQLCSSDPEPWLKCMMRIRRRALGWGSGRYGAHF